MVISRLGLGFPTGVVYGTDETQAAGGIDSKISKLIKDFKESRHRHFGIYSAPMALGEIGVPAIIKLLKDSDPDVRELAADALYFLGEFPEDGHTIELESEAVSALIGTLKEDINVDVRISVARALRGIGKKANEAVILPALIGVSKDNDVQVRRDIVFELGEIRKKLKGVEPTLAKEAVSALIEALKDIDVQKVAMRSLGKFGKEASEAIPALVEILKDRDIELSVEAAKTLGKIGEQASKVVPALIEAWKEKDNDFFYRLEFSYFEEDVVVALSEFGEQAIEAVPVFIEILKDDGSHLSARMDSAKALKNIGEKVIIDTVPGLKEILQNIDVYIAKAKAIGNTGLYF